MTQTPMPVQTSVPKLYRADDGRLIAGVAMGVAVHLRVEPRWVRLAFVLLAVAGGAGVLLYAGLWLVVPVRRTTGAAPRSSVAPTLLLSIGAVGLGAALLLQLYGVVQASAAPIVLVVVGAALVWLRSDEEQRQRFSRHAAGFGRGGGIGWLQLVAGGVLVLVGGGAFLASRGTLGDVWQVLLSGLVVTAGLAVLITPWFVGLLRDRDAERRARIRSEERADIAAHVHDSVLQTLTLIQRSAGDPGSVSRLARAQERDLRHWLYEPVPDAAATVRGALEAAVAEIEDAHGVALELVCVGDAALNERLLALVAASREAMVNAVKYGGSNGPVSVYAEVADDQIVVYVRDRGPGFDIDTIPADRRGIRESIIGRMQRHGGEALVRADGGEGTQVELRMKVSA